jgi:hypothetical protein
MVVAVERWLHRSLTYTAYSNSAASVIVGTVSRIPKNVVERDTALASPYLSVVDQPK